MDKKQQYKRELREKVQTRLAFEKGRMELEHQERLRDCKIEKGKDLISHKAEIKATFELDYERKSNALTLEHYQVIREIQTTNKDKY